MREQRILPLTVMARRLGVRRKNLKAEAESGRLPCIRIGEDLLFDPEAVERTLATRAQEVSR
jgi:hypothetical protein